MPSDVLKQIQSFANGGEVQSTLKNQLNGIIESVNNAPEKLGVLTEIFNNVTKSSNNFGNAMERLVYYFDSFENKIGKVKSAFSDFGNSINSIDASSLNKVSESLARIEKSQNQLIQGVQLFSNLDVTINKLNDVAKSLAQIKNIASKGIEIKVNYSNLPKINKTEKAQSFNRGGSIKYTSSNTRKAKTGGIFTGKRHGDKEMIFANAGEAIITEKALKSGAKQTGMSVASYVNSLNSGNLHRLKTGRSFASGGIIGGRSKIKQKKSDEWLVKHHMESQSLTTIERILGDQLRYLSDFKKDFNAFVDLYRNNPHTGPESSHTTSSRTSNTPSPSPVGHAKDMNAPKPPSRMDEINRKLRDNGSGHIRRKDIDLQEDWNEIFDRADQAQKKYIKSAVEGLSKLNGQYGKLGTFLAKGLKPGATEFQKNIALVGALTGNIIASIDSLKKFIVQQANLNIKFTESFQSLKAFSGMSQQTFTKMGSSLKLTREQMAQFGDIMSQIGRTGIHSVEVVGNVAENLKSTLGKVDLTVLKQATEIINDLPSGQVDVLFGVHAKFDDQANLLANMDSKQIDKIINLQMKGAFGNFQGGIELNQKDRSIVELQEQNNKIMDDIYAILYESIPSIASAGIMRGSLLKELAGTAVKIGSVFLPVIGKINSSILARMNTPIQTTDVGNGITRGLGRHFGRFGRNIQRIFGRNMGRHINAGIGRINGLFARFLGPAAITAVIIGIGVAIHEAIWSALKKADKEKERRSGQFDKQRNLSMLKGSLAKQGYDWWWHSLTGYNKETGEPRQFFIEYFTCNPELAEDKPILGQNTENKSKGKKPSYFMLKVGGWGKEAKQIHNFYSMKEFKCPDDKLDIKIGDKISLTEKHMKGFCKVTEEEAKNHPEYMSNAGEMKWDLDIDKQITFNVGYGASSFFRKLNSFEMFWHVEGVKTQYKGTIEWMG